MNSLGTITTVIHGQVFNKSLRPFDGQFIARSSASPKYRPSIRGGRIHKHRDGLDLLCLGVARKVYHPHSYSRFQE